MKYIKLKDGRYEHRVVYRKAHGSIPFGWEVHHIDGNPSNNFILNLIALPKKFHEYLHDFQRRQDRWCKREETESLLNIYLTNQPDYIKIGTNYIPRHGKIKKRKRNLLKQNSKQNKLKNKEIINQYNLNRETAYKTIKLRKKLERRANKP